MTNKLNTRFERVMIIDDNSIDLYIASRIITKNNFGESVLIYSAAEEALKYLQENHDNFSMLPQIIFVDIYMPLMTGFEFLEAYDKLPSILKNYCKVFIISSTIDDNDIAKANSNENVVGFLIKPINKDFLDRIKLD